MACRGLCTGVASKLPEVGSTALELPSLGGALSLLLLTLLCRGTIAKKIKEGLGLMLRLF